MHTLLARDEREASIDRTADRFAYLVISYGVLAIIAYRSFVDGQASWDLLGLVVLGGVVGAAYRGLHGALGRRAVVVLAITVLVALAVAVMAIRLSG